MHYEWAHTEALHEIVSFISCSKMMKEGAVCSFYVTYLRWQPCIDSDLWKRPDCLNRAPIELLKQQPLWL